MPSSESAEDIVITIDDDFAVTTTTALMSAAVTVLGQAAAVNCTSSAAFEHFPNDLFSAYQRSHGAILIHILVIVYLFVAMAVLCDNYFVPALQKLSEMLDLSDDVAGATFMAAGSSAPELFTALIGVFVTNGDVGTGTIVGSVVFNILAIVGLCGILFGQEGIMLNCWPIIRDSLFYAVTIVVLILLTASLHLLLLIIQTLYAIFTHNVNFSRRDVTYARPQILSDVHITWFESLLMLALYGLYIFLMKYSGRLQQWFTSRVEGIAWLDFPRPFEQVGLLADDSRKIRTDYAKFENDGTAEPAYSNLDNADGSYQRQSTAVANDPAVVLFSLVGRRHRRWTFCDFILFLQIHRGFHARTRIIAATRLLIIERRQLISEGKIGYGYGYPPVTNGQDTSTSSTTRRSTFRNTRALSQVLAMEDSDVPIYDAWKTKPTTGVWKWALLYPLKLVFSFTIPDCRRESSTKYYLATFALSILWTSTLAYITVWMAVLVGHTIGIPDSIIGVTFLAAGTSIPDALASLIVCRRGFADMAVSNTIGSNVFDVLVGLGLPWFLKTAITSPGSTIHPNSTGLVYWALLLFLTLAAFLMGVHFNKWQLSRKLGFFFIGVYGLFLVVSSWVEASHTLPACP